SSFRVDVRPAARRGRCSATAASDCFATSVRRRAPAAAPRPPGPYAAAPSARGAVWPSTRRRRRSATPAPPAHSCTPGRSAGSAASRPLPPSSSPGACPARLQTSSPIPRPTATAASSAATSRRVTSPGRSASAGACRSRACSNARARWLGRRRSRVRSGVAMSGARSEPRRCAFRLGSCSSTTSTRPAPPPTRPRPPCAPPAPTTCSSSRSHGLFADARTSVESVEHLGDSLLDGAADDDEVDAARSQVVELPALKRRREWACKLARAVLDPAEVVVADDPAVVVHGPVDELVQPSIGTPVRRERPLQRRPRRGVAEEELARVDDGGILPTALPLGDPPVVGKRALQTLRLPELAA